MLSSRYFEKITFLQFKNDICDDIELYNKYELPKRSTSDSCGYDIKAIKSLEIAPGEIVKIPTGIKAYFLKDEFLMLVVRSSMGFKYNVRMCNQVGIIDSDYYNNCDNEGHIWIALQNEGKKIFSIKSGDAICQGIFLNYLTCDDINNNVRVGGIGSTNSLEDKENW